MLTIIESIQHHARKIEAGEIERVAPGMPAAFTAACQAGDTIVQGDLYMTIVDRVPAGYVLQEKPSKQLVPGNTQGARHCLDSLAGVKLYLPKKWDEESLEGPCLVLTKSRRVLHPVHGPVSLMPDHIILCSYQREFDKEVQRERRTRD